MKTILIIYWSQTGNTEAMAHAIAQGIEEEGNQAKLLEVSEAEPEILKKANVFALGCPAMGGEVLEEDEMEPFVTKSEACVLLTQKRNEKDYEFEIEVSLMIDSDRLFEDSRPTYTNIRKYVFDKYGIKLQLKDIADVKRDYGMKMKVNKHLIKGDEPVRRKCTPNKRKYIIEALKYYHAI